MEDLLREEEFKTHHEPTLWQRFKVFYIIAAILPLLGFLLRFVSESMVEKSTPEGFAFTIPILFYIPLPFFLTLTYKTGITYKKLLKALMRMVTFFSISFVVLRIISDIIFNSYPNPEAIGETLGSAIAGPLLTAFITLFYSVIAYPFILGLRKLKKLLKS